MAAGSIDKYIGTWKNDRCYENELLKVGANRDNTYFNYSFVFTKTSPTKASYQAIYRFYLPTDKKCTGSVIYTITKTGEKSISKDKEEEYGDTEGFSRLGENSIVYEGSKTIDGSAADLLEVTETPLSKKTAPFPVGSAVPQKTLLPEVEDLNGDNAKAIAKINGDKLTLVGDRGVYPTTFKGVEALINTLTFTKQPQ